MCVYAYILVCVCVYIYIYIYKVVCMPYYTRRASPLHNQKQKRLPLLCPAHVASESRAECHRYPQRSCLSGTPFPLRGVVRSFDLSPASESACCIINAGCRFLSVHGLRCGTLGMLASGRFNSRTDLHKMRHEHNIKKLSGSGSKPELMK